MAIYRVTTHKRLVAAPEVRWTNVYVIESTNLIVALDDAEDIANIEAAVMYDVAEIYRVSSRGILSPSLGSQRTVAIVGGNTPTDATGMLPLWNVAGVILADDLGKDERKYLKLPLFEESIIGQALTNGVFTDLTLNYCAPLLALGILRGPGGETVTAINAEVNVRMRQTSWNRRFRPGFRRGWVPV